MTKTTGGIPCSTSLRSPEPVPISALPGNDPSRCPHRVRRYNRDCAQILNCDGNVAALIEALSNGRWAVFVGDQRLTKRTFSTVPIAFDWWCVNAASAIEARRAETSGSVADESAPEGDAQKEATNGN